MSMNKRLVDRARQRAAQARQDAADAEADGGYSPEFISGLYTEAQHHDNWAAELERREASHDLPGQPA